MGAFEYTALDAGGKERKGVLEGDTARQVRQLLREQQLLPVTVSEVAQKEAKRQRAVHASCSGVSAARPVAASRASSPPWCAPACRSKKRCSPSRSRPRSRACRASSWACAPRSWKATRWPTASANSRACSRRSTAPRCRPASSPATWTPCSSAWPTTPRAASRCARRSLGAMLYPIVLIVMCFAIVSMPAGVRGAQGRRASSSSKAKLPLITRVLIARQRLPARLRHLRWSSPSWSRRSLFTRWLRNPAARRRFHRFLLRLPLDRARSSRGFNTARFTRTLSILTGSSVPVLEALRIAGEVVTNLPMRDAVHGSRRSACAKARPSAARSAQSKLFPPMTIHLISSGESSGELETMLERAADEPGTRAGWSAERAGRPAGSAADRRDGRLRDGHRFCNAAADLPAEQLITERVSPKVQLGPLRTRRESN